MTGLSMKKIMVDLPEQSCMLDDSIHGSGRVGWSQKIYKENMRVGSGQEVTDVVRRS